MRGGGQQNLIEESGIICPVCAYGTVFESRFGFLALTKSLKKINGEGGIRTRGTGVYPYDGLANRCLKPLGHLSE